MPGLIPEYLDVRMARFKLRRSKHVGLEPRVRGRVWIHGDGEVWIGDRVFFDGSIAPIELHPWQGAVIAIGDDCYIGGGTSMEATRLITLDARVRMGAFCRVMDNHFHAVRGDRFKLPEAHPVLVGRDVEVGARSLLLAGSHVEHGSDIGAGSVVTHRATAGAR